MAKAFGNGPREVVPESGDAGKAEGTKAMWVKAFGRIDR